MQAAASKARAAVRFRVTAPADADWPECADGYSGNGGVTIAGVQVESMKRRMKAAHPLRDEQGVGWGDGARAGNGEEKGDHGERARSTLPTPASRYGVAHGDNLKPLNLLGHHVILGGFKRAWYALNSSAELEYQPFVALHAGEPLFLGGRNDAVPREQTGCAVVIEGGDAE